MKYLTISIKKWTTDGQRLFSLLRLTAFDTSTPAGRSKERYRRVTLTALSSAIARVISVLVSFITVAIAVDYLGTERYALWLIITSTITMLGFADFGIGNGLLGAISEASGKNDELLAKRYISSAFFSLIVIAIVFGVAFLFVYPLIPWARVFNLTSSIAIFESGPSAAIYFAFFLVGLPLNLVYRVQMGYQRGYIAHFWQAIGSILGLVGVLWAISFQAGLPWLILAIAGGSVFVALIASATEHIKSPWLRPDWNYIESDAVKRIMSTGASFFVIQVSMAIGYQSDNLVLAQILGAESVAQYAIPLRLFNVVPLVTSFMLAPLWPAYGESRARGDIEWIKNTLYRSIRVSLLLNVPVVLLLLIFSQRLLHLWVGSVVEPSLLLLVGLGLYATLTSVGGPFSMLLNGLGAIKFQAVCALLMALANILISIFLVNQLGVPGVVLGTVIAQIVFIFVPSFIYIPRLLKATQHTATLSKT